jgi:acetyltransferase EpsM
MHMQKDSKRIVILGGHGDGVVVASALQDLRTLDRYIIPYGFLNDFEPPGTMIADIPVLDKIENAKTFLDQKDVYFISALLKAKESYGRSQKIEQLRIPLERYYTLIHPHATVSKSAKVGYGTFIGPHANIMPNVIIGNHCSFRASANVGHDCIIGNYCYMGPNSNVSGRVKLGDGVHVGPNASVLDRLEIGSYSVIGIGSVVLENVPAFAIAFGHPAKIRGSTEKGEKN